MPKVLVVKICSAKNLYDPNWVSSFDPYCVVKCGHQTNKTSFVRKSTNPVWNETFVLEYNENIQKLEFEVWDEDIGKNDFVGEASLRLKDEILLKGFEGDLQLFRKGGQKAGVLKVDFQWRNGDQVAASAGAHLVQNAMNLDTSKKEDSQMMQKQSQMMQKEPVTMQQQPQRMQQQPQMMQQQPMMMQQPMMQHQPMMMQQPMMQHQTMMMQQPMMQHQPMMMQHQPMMQQPMMQHQQPTVVMQGGYPTMQTPYQGMVVQQGMMMQQGMMAQQPRMQAQQGGVVMMGGQPMQIAQPGSVMQGGAQPMMMGQVGQPMMMMAQPMQMRR